MPIKILDASSAPTTGQRSGPEGGAAFQLVVTGTGSVAATAIIEVSLNNNDWIAGPTITATGTSTASEIAVLEYAYPDARARLTSLTGGGANAVVWMS